MHTSILHWDRRWPRVGNHMDARHCPDCGATVHGKHGQHEHQQWHADQAELYEQLGRVMVERDFLLGITEERVQVPVRWTATIEPSASGAIDTLEEPGE